MAWSTDGEIGFSSLWRAWRILRAICAISLLQVCACSSSPVTSWNPESTGDPRQFFRDFEAHTFSRPSLHFKCSMYYKDVSEPFAFFEGWLKSPDKFKFIVLPGPGLDSPNISMISDGVTYICKRDNDPITREPVAPNVGITIRRLMARWGCTEVVLDRSSRNDAHDPFGKEFEIVQQALRGDVNVNGQKARLLSYRIVGVGQLAKTTNCPKLLYVDAKSGVPLKWCRDDSNNYELWESFDVNPDISDDVFQIR